MRFEAASNSNSCKPCFYFVDGYFVDGHFVDGHFVDGHFVDGLVWQLVFVYFWNALNLS